VSEHALSSLLTPAVSIMLPGHSGLMVMCLTTVDDFMLPLKPSFKLGFRPNFCLKPN